MVSYNYLGQIMAGAKGLPFEIDRNEVPGDTDPENIRPHLIDIIALMKDGRLTVNYVYSRNVHLEETIRNLADSFKKELDNVLAHCLDPGSFDITPSDFKLAGIDQQELDNIYD
jgi:non-ribosomal peptide synthase protein (TIGR01720 family)